MLCFHPRPIASRFLPLAHPGVIDSAPPAAAPPLEPAGAPFTILRAAPLLEKRRSRRDGDQCGCGGCGMHMFKRGGVRGMPTP